MILAGLPVLQLDFMNLLPQGGHLLLKCSDQLLGLVGELLLILRQRRHAIVDQSCWWQLQVAWVNDLSPVPFSLVAVHWRLRLPLPIRLGDVTVLLPWCVLLEGRRGLLPILLGWGRCLLEVPVLLSWVATGVVKVVDLLIDVLVSALTDEVAVVHR